MPTEVYTKVYTLPSVRIVCVRFPEQYAILVSHISRSDSVPCVGLEKSTSRWIWKELHVYLTFPSARQSLYNFGACEVFDNVHQLNVRLQVRNILYASQNSQWLLFYAAQVKQFNRVVNCVTQKILPFKSYPKTTQLNIFELFVYFLLNYFYASVCAKCVKAGFYCFSM